MVEELTEEEKKTLHEILDTWETAHRTIRFFSALGRLLKWLAAFGTAIAVLWAYLHGASHK